MSERMGWRLVPILVLLLGAQANAGGITLFNTGVDASGTPLPLGSLDPHWSIIAGPGITSPTPAVVLADQRAGDPYSQSLDSEWVWVHANGVAATHVPYVFQLTFNLTGFNPATATLSGSWSVDNIGKILLNGSASVGSGALSLGERDGGSNYGTLHSFSITGGFISGVNTLDFRAVDLGDIGGLNVTDLKLAASPLISTAGVPEPSTLVMLAIGAVTVAAFARRCRGRSAMP
jgi:hypothetical protein